MAGASTSEAASATVSSATYATGIPVVLQPEVAWSRKRELGKFFVVPIECQVLEQGDDHLESQATEFGLLIHDNRHAKQILSCINGLVDNIFLNDGSVVSFKTTAAIPVELSSPELVTDFTKSLLRIVVGQRPTLKSDVQQVLRKNYYVVPLAVSRQANGRNKALKLARIDWVTIQNVNLEISSGLPPVHSVLTYRYVKEGSEHNDTYVVTSRLNNRVMAGYKVCPAGSCLTRGSGGRREIIEIGRATHFRHRLTGSIYRGAVRLPTILHKIEMLLLVEELKSRLNLNKNMSPAKVLEALTAPACQLESSYEELEFLGDSVLKLLSACSVMHHPGQVAQSIIRNAVLAECAERHDLRSYIRAERFMPEKWTAPGLVPQFWSQRQCISSKQFADVVEALLGTCVLDEQPVNMYRPRYKQRAQNLIMGLAAANRLAEELGIPMDYTVWDIEGLDLLNIARLDDVDVEKLQQQLGYTFKNRQLLEAAVDVDNVTPRSGEIPSTFYRLRNLGEAVLDFLYTLEIVCEYPETSAGGLNNLKQAMLNREHYACICVQRDLQGYVKKGSQDHIFFFVHEFLRQRGESPIELWFGIQECAAPEELGFLVVTLAASVYIDSNYDIEAVWKVFKPLLQPFPTPETVRLHPSVRLEGLCNDLKIDFNTIMKIENVGESNEVEVRFTIRNEEGKPEIIARATHIRIRVAKRLAAIQALKHPYFGGSDRL